jgi:hypothetical protein
VPSTKAVLVYVCRWVGRLGEDCPDSLCRCVLSRFMYMRAEQYWNIVYTGVYQNGYDCSVS